MTIRAFPFGIIALLAVLVIVDVISVVLLFQNRSLLFSTALHGLASLLGTLALVWNTSSKQSKQANYLGYIFLFQFIFILPVIGLIGAFIFSRHTLFINGKDKHDEEVDALLTSSEGDSLDLPLDNDKKYRELLRYQDPESYLQLILSTQYMDEQNAIRILKIALNTDIENVRLLAQARLDSKENHINQTLEKYIDLTKKTKHKKNAHLYLEIAQQYWDLAYLGLAKDSVLDHVLAQLQKYTHIVKIIAPTNPKSYHLSAKGLLLSKNYQEAKQQLQLAIKTGMPRNKIIPLLNEIDFYEQSQGVKVAKPLRQEVVSS